MTIVLTIIHVVVCILLVLVILLQAGKGADMGAIFGGGSSQTLFGASGGQTFMSKATTGLAIGFLVTCLTLAYIGSHSSTLMSDDAGAGTAVPVSGDTVEDSEDSQPTTEPAAEPTTDDADTGSEEPAGEDS